jgi:hypothetical protein
MHFLKCDLKFCIFETYISCDDDIQVLALKRILYILIQIHNKNRNDKQHGEEDPLIYSSDFANVIYGVIPIKK